MNVIILYEVVISVVIKIVAIVVVTIVIIVVINLNNAFNSSRQRYLTRI